MEVYSPELVSAQQEFLIANAGQRKVLPAAARGCAKGARLPLLFCPLSGYAIGISGSKA